jgi:hypothetical protein
MAAKQALFHGQRTQGSVQHRDSVKKHPNARHATENKINLNQQAGLDMQTQLITARRLGWLCGVLYCTQLQAATVSCTNLESWLASKAYNGGSTVQHEQKAYKANWWNQNKNPAQYANPYQEWTKQGDCDGVVANQPPQVSLTAPAAGSSHSAGTVVTLGNAERQRQRCRWQRQ